MQNVQTAILPFHTAHKQYELPEGLSLSQMVERVYPRPIEGMRLVALIDGHRIPKKYWNRTYPKSHTLITFNIVPTGGGGGKKNGLGFILSIAAVVVAPYISAPLSIALAGGVGPATLAQITLAKAITQIGLGMVASLASSMLSSTPSQSRQGAVNIAESQTQFIEGASNSVLRYGVIPVNLGTNRMFPPQAALPYTETKSNRQYVRQLFTYGFGNVVVSEEKIGETSLFDYSGVETEYRLDGDLKNSTSLYSNDVFQEGFSILLSKASIAEATIVTTQLNTEEAEIDLTFSQGLTVYDDKGKRGKRTVQFEVVFSEAGMDNWSTGAISKSFSAKSFTLPASLYNSEAVPEKRYSKNAGIIFLDFSTGAVSYSVYNSWDKPPSTPEGKIRIGSWVNSVTKNETASIWQSYFSSQNDFNVSSSSGVVTVSAGTVNSKTWYISASTSQPFRAFHRIVFPSPGQYDVRIRRLTNNATDDKTRDAATLTALRSIRFVDPVLQDDVSGQAIRILATDQLNGTLDKFNAVVSTVLLYYDSDTLTWQEGISSNPAAIFRYVLQSPAFSKRVGDERINLSKLEEWSLYCDQKGFTFNNIVDYDTSIDDLLDDICAAGFASKDKKNGIYSVIIDNERPLIKALVTPRNSWGYSGNMLYPEIPHGLRVQFRNAEKGYIVDEITVYSDGYDINNAFLFETLEFKSCTSAELAYYYGRRYLATAILQKETHIFNQDFENLTYSRGDRISFVNDSILVGVGQARIKSLVYDDEITPTKIIGFIVDDTISVPSVVNFGVRVRHSDASGFDWYGVDSLTGNRTRFNLISPIDITDVVETENKWLGSLCSFTEFDKELDLIVTDIKINKDQSARITCVNYAPERFNVDEGETPRFESNITIPLELIAPFPPVLSGPIVSDETVMTRNADGSYTSRMVINLVNNNEPSIVPLVQMRAVDTTEWFRPDLLSESSEKIVITGLEQGQSYDIKIVFQRRDTSYFSLPLFINGVRFIGSSTPPPAVQNFKVVSSASTGLFEWDAVDIIDISHYEIRFTKATSGISWLGSQPIALNIVGNRISLPIQAGTYLIKAFDIDGNESATATTITSINEGAFKNVVEFLQQQPGWSGTFDNTQVIDDDLFLINTNLTGYYYFDPDPLDLSEVYENSISFALEAYGSIYSKIRSVASIRSIASIRDVTGTSGSGLASVRNIASIRGISSIRGIEESAWSVNLEVNLSTDNVTWTGWFPATAGTFVFRYIRIRLVLASFQTYISPQVVKAEAVIDMPDRYESGEDLPCPSGGVTVTYSAPFKRNPAVNITAQDGAVDDRVEFVAKDETGFTVRVWNATIGNYVSRTIDYISSGYGRVIT